MPLIDDYLNDAAEDLKAAISQIKEDSSQREIVVAVMFAAIGTEKLLKALLAEVNPGFILTKVDFDNVTAACHLDRVTDEDRLPKVAQNEGAEVVSLRTAIHRAGLFYPVVKHNAPILHAIASARDIIFHRRTCELDLEALDVLVKRDLYGALRQLTELAPQMAEIWSDDEGRLQYVSQEVANRVATIAEFDRKIAEALEKWQRRSKDEKLVKQIDTLTASRLAKEQYIASCECPACGNEAVVFHDPDFDFDWDPIEEGPAVVLVGVYPDRLKCFYCSLELTTYDEFMRVDLDDRLARGYQQAQE